MFLREKKRPSRKRPAKVRRKASKAGVWRRRENSTAAAVSAYASLVAVSNESNFRCACGFTLAPFDFAQGRLAAAWKGVCGWRLWHPFGCAQDRLRTVPFRGCGLCRWMLGVGELQIPAE